MGHHPWGHKELEATERLTLSFSYGKVKQKFSLKNPEFAVNWEILSVSLNGSIKEKEEVTQNEKSDQASKAFA